MDSVATGRRGIRTAFYMGFYIVVCMLTAMPAARAHTDDERPSAEQIIWGLACFVATLIFVLYACLHPPKSGKRRFQTRRAKRRAPRRPERANRKKQSI